MISGYLDPSGQIDQRAERGAPVGGRALLHHRRERGTDRGRAASRLGLQGPQRHAPALGIGRPAVARAHQAGDAIVERPLRRREHDRKGRGLTRRQAQAHLAAGVAHHHVHEQLAELGAVARPPRIVAFHELAPEVRRALEPAGR